MKAEQLKHKGIKEMNKEFAEAHSFGKAMSRLGRKIDVPTGKLLFYEDDIKNAIQWLKNHLPDEDDMNKTVTKNLIDEAFEDITKEVE